MDYDEWLKANSMDYRGYVIRPGSVWKDGRVSFLFVTKLGDGLTVHAIDVAKRLIDEEIEKETK